MYQTKREPLYLLQQTNLHRMIIQHHPQIGQIYVPNIKARVPNELGGYYVTTNSAGFRSDIEFQAEKGQRPRVIFFGDSFTAGFGVNNHERFSDLIGNALDIEVYNYGLSGSGTDQQLLIYEQFAKDVEADLIVVSVLVENIQRNLRSHHKTLDRYSGKLVYTPKPYFQLDKGALRLNNVPVPIARPEIAQEQQAGANGGSIPARLGIVEKLRKVYYHSRFDFLRGDRNPNVDQSDIMYKLLQWTNYQPYPDYNNPGSTGWMLMEAILDRFCKQASPTPVLIVPIPDSYYYREASLNPVYQKRFESLAHPESNVHVADVTTSLINLSATEKAQLPFKHDFHFSPYGNQRLAEFISEEITSRDLVPGVARKKYTFLASTNGKEHSVETDNYILGISCFYHNAAASLIKNGQIIAAAEEERFTRVKNDRNFPHRAINYCLEEAGIQQSELSAVVYYDNAYQTFERLIHTQLALGKDGEEAWLRVVPSWLQYKLSIPAYIRRSLKYEGKILQEAHHRSHAASAFYPSQFKQAAILTIDGVGEWATASISVGYGNEIKMLKEMRFPHSVGLLYSAFTQFTGFKVNNGEYKMMGLAPYGEPSYVDLILDNLVGLKEDGSIELNMEYFAFLAEPKMTNDKFAQLFSGPARDPNDPITQREMDIACSIQVVTEEIILRMAQHAYELTGEKYLCLAGGVALNCVANGRLLREGPFEDIWIQPAAGDSGCAVGAALDVWHTLYNGERQISEHGRSSQGGSYWGPSYSDDEIKAFLDTFGYVYHKVDDHERADMVAQLIEQEKVIGHFAGRLEYGPRALGSRSILGDARSQEMQTTINLKIKYRESFRPFAPTVLAEAIPEFFDLDRESPYMLLVAPVKEDRRLTFDRGNGSSLFEIVRQPRSDVPAITHVNYSARIQSINRADHPIYYDVIRSFQKRTGYGVIVNTSFNVRGEPIVCSPYDAYRCFMRTEMDVLILGNHVLYKKEQPDWPEEKGHLENYDPSTVTELGDGQILQELRDVFAEEFLPIANRVAKNSAGRISMSTLNLNTTWFDLPDPDSPGQVFNIPDELDSAHPDPSLIASALMQFWEHDPVNDELQPVIEKLIRIGSEEFSIEDDEDLVETVSDFVYVMY